MTKYVHDGVLLVFNLQICHLIIIKIVGSIKIFATVRKYMKYLHKKKMFFCKIVSCLPEYVCCGYFLSAGILSAVLLYEVLAKLFSVYMSQKYIKLYRK